MGVCNLLTQFVNVVGCEGIVGKSHIVTLAAQLIAESVESVSKLSLISFMKMIGSIPIIANGSIPARRMQHKVPTFYEHQREECCLYN
jgi:hypothetical protein